VPHWVRVASVCFGLLLLLPFLLALLNGRTSRGDAPLAGTGVDRQPPTQGAGGIEVDTEPSTTSDQIKLTGLAPMVRDNPPRAGDTITVNYSLSNVGGERAQMNFTFVGARNPANKHADAERRKRKASPEP
jgi:hypothetical protein